VEKVTLLLIHVREKPGPQTASATIKHISSVVENSHRLSPTKRNSFKSYYPLHRLVTSIV